MIYNHQFNGSHSQDGANPVLMFSYIITLPEEFTTPSYAIQEVALPEYENCGCLFKRKWSDLELRIFNLRDHQNFKHMYENIKKKNFIIKLDFVDHKQEVTNSIEFKVKKISSLDMGNLTYVDTNQIHSFVVRFSIEDVIYN